VGQFTVQYLPEEEIIRVHLKGAFDAQSFSMTTSKVAEEASRSNCSHILMDHREATRHLSTTEIFERPKIALKFGLSRASKIALVYSTKEDDYQFVETVGKNRGFDVKVFADMDEAIRWLKTH